MVWGVRNQNHNIRGAGSGLMANIRCRVYCCIDWSNSSFKRIVICTYNFYVLWPPSQPTLIIFSPTLDRRSIRSWSGSIDSVKFFCKFFICVFKLSISSACTSPLIAWILFKARYLLSISTLYSISLVMTLSLTELWKKLAVFHSDYISIKK